MNTITILSPAHPLRGGIAAYSERLAKAFMDEGKTVDIVSFSLQYPGFLFPGTTQFSSDPAPEGLRIRTWVNSVNPLNWIKVGLRLRAEKPDLIIVRYWLPFMGPCLGTILRLAKGNGHTRVVAVVDNLIPHESRPGDRWFTRYFIKPVDACVAMSAAVERDIRAMAPEKPVRYIPHPVYDNYGAAVDQAVGKAHLHLDPDFSYLLFFGFIRDYKGLDLLLEAMADPRIRERPIRLIVAGEYYGKREYYEDLIERLQIAHQLVLRTDFIPLETVKYYFAAADLVVQPYRSATQSGISQIAYHFNKPMIVTRVGGLPEIIEDGKEGYLVEVSPEAIATAIAEVYDKDELPALTAAVMARKHQFSWENMVAGILEMAHPQP
ncbi:MAG: glycosyltransferase [Saprospiraceae bacterium]|jgi:D-inositol-3-phosphate glycosyltransferase|nr:glycosyltransferase [Saprospiraceae bacterium]MDP4819664.1 glycosyltransferase [Saprospiraceae bacterium]MDP4998767.1 glycosyltransferase [Saprospiraceae bacterium]